MTSLDKLTEISRITESKVDSFRDAGFEELEDLVDLTEADLEYIEGVGSSKLNKIYQLLDREGIERAEKDENYQKFRGLLEELFQFESADLDFGIYRIMNERRDRIETFLDEELEEKVQEELEDFKNAEQGDAKQDLEDANEDIQENFPQWTDANGNVDDAKIPEDAQGIAQEHKEKYLNAKKELQKAEIGEETEAAIYQDLYRFFKRYYKDGDFIPQRRAANQEKYAIPYNGEEVKLHWANKDQYFFKTGEHFKDYKFNKDSYEIEFKLHDAHVEKNNKKGDDKFFVLRDENPVEQDERFLKVHFEYRPLTEEDYEKYDLSESSQSSTYKKEIRKQTEGKILSEVSSELEETLDQEVENPRSESTVLQKHLKNYRTKNENDYFIHKDLGGFLEQELDFYLKNEVFSWKEMTDDNGEIPAHVRARLNAIENIAQEIIDFVAEIEDYQKKLFEKKKFVVNTEYCITLDKIPEELYPEILENEEQIEEWKELYALEEIEEEKLKNRSSIMVDTKFFSQEFKEKLDLNGEANNKLFKSENFNALRQLESTYEGEVDCIYIDPPYNAKASKVPFKDEYEKSSWISLMKDRLELGKNLLDKGGIIYVSIDDSEVDNLRKLMDNIFGSDNFLAQLIWDLGTGTSAGHFTRSHEYILAYAEDKDTRENFEHIGDKEIIRDRAVKKISTKNPATTITFPPGVPYEGEDKELEGEIGKSEKIRIVDGSLKFEDGELANEVTLEAGWAMKDQIKSWLEGEDTYDTKGQKIKRFVFTEEGRLDYEKIRSKINPKTVIDDAGSTKRGTSELSNKFANFPDIYPKPSDLLQRIIGWAVGGREDPIVLDFFAGSGTAAEAALKLEDEGINLNYMLVEQGDHFNSLLKPRITKAVYSREWNKREPESVSNRSHIFKYQKLEQFEDTLDSLDSGSQQTGVAEFTSNTLKYFLNFEVDGKSLLDLDGLKEPFNYEMRIREGDEAKRETIDLVETFNYLLGLEVEKIRRYEKLNREYRVVKGTKDEEEIAVVWRMVTDDPNDEFYEDEREFLKSEVLGDEDTVYINHDSALEAKPIEKKFRSEMWQD